MIVLREKRVFFFEKRKKERKKKRKRRLITYLNRDYDLVLRILEVQGFIAGYAVKNFLRKEKSPWRLWYG